MLLYNSIHAQSYFCKHLHPPPSSLKWCARTKPSECEYKPALKQKSLRSFLFITLLVSFVEFVIFIVQRSKVLIK